MKLYNTEIHSLGNPQYLLRRPLLVTIEEYNDEALADIPEFDLYACGVSPSLALMKLKAEIVSTYERLVDLGPEQLGSMLLHCFEAMRAVIEVSGEQKKSLHD